MVFLYKEGMEKYTKGDIQRRQYRARDSNPGIFNASQRMNRSIQLSVKP
jgi:hypothetical protein